MGTIGLEKTHRATTVAEGHEFFAEDANAPWQLP
jgi:hypothetical protein